VNEIDKQFAEEAHKYHQAVLRVTVEIKKNLWDLAIILKHIRDNKLYKFYDDTWESYLASLNSSISRSFAHKLITNYEIWGEEYHIPEEKLRIDQEKLWDIGTMITGKNLTPEEVEENLEQARTLSRSDVKQLKSGHEYEPRYKMVTCPHCGMEIKVAL